MIEAWMGVIGVVVGAVVSLGGVTLKSLLDRRSVLGLKGADLDRDAARRILEAFDAAVAVWVQYRQQEADEAAHRRKARDRIPAARRMETRTRLKVERAEIYAAIRAIDRRVLELRVPAVRDRLDQVTRALWLLDDLSEGVFGPWRFEGAVHIIRDEVEQVLGAVIRHHGRLLPEAELPACVPATTKLMSAAEQIEAHIEEQCRAQEEYGELMAQREREERAEKARARKVTGAKDAAKVRVSSETELDPPADDEPAEAPHSHQVDRESEKAK